MPEPLHCRTSTFEIKSQPICPSRYKAGDCRTSTFEIKSQLTLAWRRIGQTVAHLPLKSNHNDRELLRVQSVTVAHLPLNRIFICQRTLLS